jgi:hypothetical protein
MTEDVLNLADIPDLSGIADDAGPEPFVDGWYEGVILERREFTDKNGNDRVFESSDEPAQKSGRNIRLQVTLRRQSDGRALSMSTLLNYQPEDLTQETIQSVLAQKEKVKTSGEQWGTLFRPFMTLQRLSKLQRIAGIRQLQKNGNGGLDLRPLYGKTAYFKIGEDSRNALYKEVKDFSETAPKRIKLL